MLARWVQCDDEEVAMTISIALGERWRAGDSRSKARLLFAKVLDATGGGLKIQTIHSFCQSLLASFPLEAGLVPGFKPLDDRATGRAVPRSADRDDRAGRAQPRPTR